VFDFCHLYKLLCYLVGLCTSSLVLLAIYDLIRSRALPFGLFLRPYDPDWFSTFFFSAYIKSGRKKKLLLNSTIKQSDIATGLMCT
jgi:hypothetical protein